MTLWTEWMHNNYLKNQPISNISSSLLDSGTWKWLVSNKLEALQHLELDPNGNEQTWRWDGASACTAATIRTSLQINLPRYPLYKLIWSPLGAPKMSVCAIRALHNRLPTADRIHNTQVACYLCNTEAESIQHLFYDCQYSQYVWSVIKMQLGLQSAPLINLSGEAEYIQNRFGSKTYGSAIARVAFRTVIWALWRERNLRKNKEQLLTKEKIVNSIKFQVKYQLYSCKWPRSAKEDFTVNWD